MGANLKYEFTKFQNVLLCISPIAFIVLIWEMIPLDNLLKSAICCFLGAFIFWMVIAFANYLSCFKKIKTARMATSITMFVFVVVPLAINIVHGIHEKEYLTSYPTDNQISIKITYHIERTGGSGSIGNEWTYMHFLNKREFETGQILTVNAKNPFTITSRFIERDKIDDIGESTSKQYIYSQSDNYKKTLNISQKVHVTEQGGRRYAGSTADFKVTYTLTRVVPSSMNYWDVFLHTSNDVEYSFSVSLIVGQLLCIIAVVAVLINGKKEEAFSAEQERIKKEHEQMKKEQDAERERIRIEKEKEREFLAGKAALLERLQGQSIRQVAGVPPNVSFINGLPRDNNDAQYGSFTVYCSSSGSCYHDKMGCCSARRPMHYFNAKRTFRPCSKCCTKSRSIPRWYTDYNELKNQARYYKIDISE